MEVEVEVEEEMEVEAEVEVEEEAGSRVETRRHFRALWATTAFHLYSPPTEVRTLTRMSASHVM